MFRSGDDAARAAVAPLLDELRGELLTLPPADVVEKHLGMMAFEQRVLTAPARPERPARRLLNRPRRTAFVFGCITATIASCGLSAAGALPEPLQRITDTIAHTLGVPQPNDDGTSTGTAPTVVPKPTVPTTEPASTTTPEPNPKAEPPDAKPAAPTPHPTTTAPSATTTTSIPPVGPTDPPTFTPRPTDPPGRVDPNPPAEEPSNNSQNTPPGYPEDWREQATNMVALRLWLCTVTDSPAPPDCPQSVDAPGAQNVSWSLLGDPSRTAAAIATTTQNAAGELSTVVTVYERFRMVVTYTLPTTGSQTYRAYSSGIVEATMEWGGASFERVVLKAGPANVMPGVVVPGFQPPDVWDFMVAAKVQAAFERCTATGTTRPSCPPGGLLDSPDTNQSTLNGNVLEAAEVSFNQVTGLYTVKGTYSLTSASGAPVTGVYDATLFFNYADLQLLSITGR
jgi:hypothetical protein